ncbi:LacI family DNA-binding transcriptional regulator [Knoellia aerolata]|uniref:LacI family DNA-binding transcriptional regulator n=1 Tax=Knoellia aerolata TaxID=442954 RepID=UPI000ADF5223|nr:LacI family DNA-binding transcriptional regulator [Knoellia aerolata]
MSERPHAVTIYAVAERARVSIATVSRVLKGSSVVTESTRQKVLDAVQELEYTPSGAARSLAERRHHTLGLVLPELGGPYYAELLAGFETKAAELRQGVMLVIAKAEGHGGDAIRALATRVDGIAFLGRDVERVRRSGKKLVLIAADSLPGVEVISTENIAGARRLTEHLLAHGRTRLLFVGDPDAAHDVRERYEGFVLAHHDRGLEPAQPVLAPFRESDGQAVAERLIAGDLEADALVCGNDELALAIMARLLGAGVDVPRDIAVVGWDDVMTARYVRPGLTTVRQPVRDVGALAADRLFHLVTGSAKAPERHVLPTEVVIRGSCGCTRTPSADPEPDLYPIPTPHPSKVRSR